MGKNATYHNGRRHCTDACHIAALLINGHARIIKVVMHMERPPRIITGQRIKPAKKQRSRELRKTMTEEERILWEHLRDNRLGVRFRRQQVIDGFIVDFYCHSAGLIVEVDGGIHEGQKEYDEERGKKLDARGVRELRFRNHEVRHELDKVLERITEACLPDNE